MPEIMWRIRRLDEALDTFFESELWKKWTNWLFGISFVLFLVTAFVNVDTIIAVFLGQQS